MFEWDENKRQQCLEERGLDFSQSAALFDGRASLTIEAATQTEIRFLTTGQLWDGKFYTVVWTQRGEARRIISFRRARLDEERAHHARYC